MKTVGSQPPSTRVVRNTSEIISVTQSSTQCGECLQKLSCQALAEWAAVG